MFTKEIECGFLKGIMKEVKMPGGLHQRVGIQK